mmetsp:Transcript_12288/g.24490  ORF Transcript_12288/g.24490 Transcript_12288/m.24490 type:complete len:152 (-) Transcript_12288:259-714(-)|eukprot:CAMPEP_0181342954 /NCGR_PEP_ID=MMETSP1101-20121128/31303_1 /TAXON_ID=46948 /ORGANISM="Rhodomonas abbreviata, Strain Caron Lab Isolate" /LENGTH=151 /DNA_ID=CAMNT_0023454501 /DNA_START=127 /DNA_END=582 /DNA_ORIENTATION=+
MHTTYRPSSKHFVCDPQFSDDSFDSPSKSPPPISDKSEAYFVCNSTSASEQESSAAGTSARREDIDAAAETSCRSWMSLPLKVDCADAISIDSASHEVDDGGPGTCSDWIGKPWSVEESLQCDVKASSSQGVVVSYLHADGNGPVTPLFTM